MKSNKRQRARRKVTPLVRLGIADFRCNACGTVVQRDLGWKAWTPIYCGGTGRKARLYRISAPSKPNSPLYVTTHSNTREAARHVAREVVRP